MYGKINKEEPLRRFLYAIFALAALSVPAWAAGPPKKPIFRIETGTHTAAITRIATDAENRYLATGSYDKTVRIWTLPDGELFKTLRPPIGDGEEGKIYAVAMSPDGSTVAAGGWTGFEWDESNSIYIFSVESGKMIRRIPKLPSVIFNLAYSKDGRYLAASLGRDSGIRIYRTSDYKLAAEDKNYASDAYGLDFDQKGKLATASYDGYIRLYGPDFKLIAKERASGGTQPYTVRFSPDGSKIAVGFNNSTFVNVLSGLDLSVLYSPNTAAIDNGDLSKVSWSADGSSLYAGGRYAVNFVNHIFRWPEQGRGPSVSIPASNDTIMHIIPMGGGVAFSSGDPSFGIISPEDRKTLYVQSSNADFRAMHEKFLVNPDATAVRFSYGEAGTIPAIFSVVDRSLTMNPSESPNLYPPIVISASLEVTGWEYSQAPKLGQVPLELKQFEFSRSLAIAHSGDNFILGTEWYLRMFDSEGFQEWEVPTPGAAWAVNLAPNRKLVIAAFGDGTIRWFRADDGAELLALYPYADKTKWVVWTPSGYFDFSADAEDLIGWHKNIDKDKEAQFYPLEKYAGDFYKPEAVAKILVTLNEEDAIAKPTAAKKRPDRNSWRVLRTTPKIILKKKRR